MPTRIGHYVALSLVLLLSTICLSGQVSDRQGYTLDRVLELLDTIRATKGVKLNLNMLKRWIQQEGVSFQPSQEDTVRLKKAGATDDLLKVIETSQQLTSDQPKPIGPPPAPVPKEKEGYLTVTCVPVDCSIFMGLKKIGETKGGKLEGYKLPVGSERVDVEASGYEGEPKNQRFTITDNETTRVDFKLKPTHETLQNAGAELFTRMIQALGGEAGLKEIGFVRGSGGTANVYDREGKPTTWSLVTLIKMPDKAKFTVSRGGQKYEIGPTAEGYQWSKAPKGPECEDLEEALRLIRENQLEKVIERLKKNRISLVGEHVPPLSGEDVVLRAEGNPDSFVITLDSGFRPKEVRLDSSGLNSGLKILFGNYVELSKGFYPKATQVVLPTTPRRGVEARYEKIEVSPVGVKDGDFIIKKGFLRR